MKDAVSSLLNLPDVRVIEVEMLGSVLGEVRQPSVITLREQTSIMESIGLAQGFKDGADKGAILLMRGGLDSPELTRIDTHAILEEGQFAANVNLQAGDIVYVSKSTWAATRNPRAAAASSTSAGRRRMRSSAASVATER